MVVIGVVTVFEHRLGRASAGGPVDDADGQQVRPALDQVKFRAEQALARLKTLKPRQLKLRGKAEFKLNLLAVADDRVLRLRAQCQHPGGLDLRGDRKSVV